MTEDDFNAIDKAVRENADNFHAYECIMIALMLELVKEFKQLNKEKDNNKHGN